MTMLKLVAVFAVLILLIVKKQPLYIAAPAARIFCWILFGVPLGEGATAIYKALISKKTLNLLLMMYLITFMQEMIKFKNGIDRSQKALTRRFNNNWITCTVAPFVIGLLPAAPAVFISGDVIDKAVGDNLDPGRKATAASFFRHVSEAFVPTYAAILMALALTGQSTGSFVLGMLPLMIIMVLIGCMFLYWRRVPVKAEGEPSKNKRADLKEFVLGIWPVLVAIILIVAFNVQVLLAVAIVTVAYFFLGKFKFENIKPFFKTALQPKVIAQMLSVFVFSAILGASGAIKDLPGFFESLPIPTYLVFMLICFFGSIVAGSMTMTTTVLPLAFDAIPGAGLPLLCLLMSAIYAAMQISPTHVCLTLSCENFDVPLSTLIKHTLPIIITFLFVAVLYYNAMLMLGF
jgi:integral membrane protein (TIGR00529 family)